MPNRPLRLGETRKVALYGQVGKRWLSEAKIKQEGGGGVRAWRARTRVGAPTGTRQVEAVGRTKTEARSRLADAVEGVRKLTPTVNPDATLADYVTAWLARIDEEKRLSPGTRHTYREAAESCVVPARGTWLLRALSAANISEYLRTEYEVRPGRVSTIRHVITAALDLAIQEGAILPPNPARSAVRMPRTRPDPSTLSPEAVAELYRRAAVFDEKPQSKMGLRDILLVMGGTGVRTGEVLAFIASDLDLSADPPRVTVSGTIKDRPTLHRQPQTKTMSGWRTVTLPPFVAEILEARATGLGPDDLLFHTSVGTPHRPDNLRRALRGIAKIEPTLGPVTPKAFRRGVASALAQVDLEAAASQLGHANTRTLRFYSSARPVADNAALLAALDPDVGVRAEAWKAIEDTAKGQGLDLRGDLARWHSAVQISPAAASFGLEPDAAAADAARWAFVSAVAELRASRFPKLDPEIQWSPEALF